METISSTALAVEGRAEQSYVRRLVALFCAGWAVIYVDRTILYPLLTVIASEFGLTGFQTGLISGTYFTLYVAAMLPAGLLSERLGLKRTLVLFSFVSAVGMAGFGSAAVNFLALLAMAGIHGAGAGSYYTMAYSITIHTVPSRNRGIASGVINGGMSLGLGAGLALAGPLYYATGSWRMPFLILAVPTFLMAALFQRAIREVPVSRRRDVPVWDLLRDPTLLRMNLSAFCVLYGWWVLLSWGPVFFQSERNLGLTMSGLYTLVIAVTAMPSGLLLGRLSDRIGRKRIILTMLPLMALSLAVIPQVQSRTGMLLALMAYGVVGKLAWDPLAISWLGDYVARYRPEAVGTAVALFSFLSVLSAVVGPPLTGWIKDVTGSLAGGFYVAAGLALVGFALSLGPADGAAGATS
ncbi:MAG: transporter [candidate division NC10 bacterium]|nr:transporter [candidate division NC10 bacterium]MBS1117212.1 transporter [candidate division NC10 bacterium]